MNPKQYFPDQTVRSLSQVGSEMYFYVFQELTDSLQNQFGSAMYTHHQKSGNKILKKYVIFNYINIRENLKMK